MVTSPRLPGEGQQHIQKQTRPLVREGAPQKQDRNCQRVINIWSWARDGARRQELTIDWSSVSMWLWLDFDYPCTLSGGKVTSGGVRCSKWTPIYIYKRPTPPLSIRRINEREKKQRPWHWTNIWPWVPAGPDARCERAGWLPAVSFYFCSPCNSPWRPIGLWDVRAPTFSRQSAHRCRWGCQRYAPATLYPQEDSWCSFLLEAESTPGP
jgi:hypothetical protein